MKRYDDRILSLLLDRYEGSLLYEGRNKLNISIAVKLTKAVVPEYFDQSSTEYETIEEQLEALERSNLIRIVWDKQKKHIIEKCELNTDELDRAYKSINRRPRRDKEQFLSAILNEFIREDGAVGAYAAYIADRLHSGKSIRGEVDIDDPEAFDKVCRLIKATEENEDECFVRELSIQCFRDSKTAERYMSKAVGILRRFSDRLKALSSAADMSDDEILEEFGIYKNPSWIMLKGSGSLKIGTTAIELKQIPSGIGIAGADVDKIMWSAQLRPSRILTIENLTSFHRWRDLNGDTLCIYLGGFADKYQRAMLKALYASYPDSEYMHFGDIDCGGFCIWKALCEETGISFGLIKMDVNTYLEKYAEGRPLTENDRKRLYKMLEDEFFKDQRELFQLMLEKGMKTEQEAYVL